MRKRNIKKQIWIDTKEDVQNLRMKYIEEVTPLKAEREKLKKMYNKTNSVTDKNLLEVKINILTKDINTINSKIQTCRRIINKAEKGEKENWIIQKRLEDNKMRNEKENTKNKCKIGNLNLHFLWHLSYTLLYVLHFHS